MRPFVISIAAVSGGGKTTIVRQLSEKLHKSKSLFFDNYDFEGTDDIINWVDSGAIYDEWNLSPLLKDLEILLSEQLNFIILDYPFAYKHSMIRGFIDFTVFIDTPLDVALARRLTRDFQNDTNRIILQDMDNYISRGRRGYLDMLKTIKPDSDIIVDGNLPVFEIVNIIYDRIKRCK
ncbi:hypothetical protein [Psychrobacillus sp. FSL K6-1415]|uniref:hypothetical protein n=1 Tax=Psychrobacillus sp. FSL K6-1415 TaxID=2921544 RepID=UPI0030FC5CC9